MELAKEGYKVTLTITPKLVEIAENKAKELDLIGQFNGFYSADAREINA
ncbi:hypothetical protein [Metabacillus arenae]|uniref:Uncharacterized protein n=1 Tax=Metabacillus arenae TaxID=2771434 RepID=A0A926NL47_9BACI|nr:hypothetical protein [Metabacillus arenae]MBD1381968.1 hypothetical protein [Metabacillus arenae]